MYIHLPNAVTDDLHSEQCNFWSTSISLFLSRNDHSAQNTVISVCFKCTHSVCIVNHRIRLSQCAVPRYVFLSPLLCHLPPLHLKVFFCVFLLHVFLRLSHFAQSRSLLCVFFTPLLCQLPSHGSFIVYLLHVFLHFFA